MTRTKYGVVSAALLSALLVSTSLPAEEASVRRLADGIPVKLALAEALSSATAEAGEAVHLEVAEDVRVENVTVIPSGSAAGGHVVVAEHKKRMGRGGKLNFAVDYVKLPNGDNVKVRASAAREGKDKMGKVIARTVLVSPLFLLMHGKDVNIPKGTTFPAYIDGDHEIAALSMAPASTGQASDPQPTPAPKAAYGAQLSSQAQPSADPSAAPSGDSSTLVLKSSPDGADITLDGDYVGSTPSTLRVKPGRHTITVERSGFKTWERSLNVTSDGTITVDATLERSF